MRREKFAGAESSPFRKHRAKPFVYWGSCAAEKRNISDLKPEMVEVRGVEPLSEMESTELLRVYPAFDLGISKRTSALSRNHPLGSVPLSARAERP